MNNSRAVRGIVFVRTYEHVHVRRKAGEAVKVDSKAAHDHVLDGVFVQGPYATPARLPLVPVPAVQLAPLLE